MLFPLLLLIFLLNLAILVWLYLYLRPQDFRTDLEHTQQQQAQELEHRLGQLAEILRQEFRQSRSELSRELRQNREELARQLDQFGQHQQQQIDTLTTRMDDRLTGMSDRLHQMAKDNRDEQQQNLRAFQAQFTKNVEAFNEVQKEKFDQLTAQHRELVQTTEQRLEQMRATVDEKLQKTLEEKLGHSFRQVSAHLEAVQKGLGEMQHLAHGVGDLKKVLSNVKTRGVLGEVQLEGILESLLAPEQYERNVRTRRESRNHIEFAIRLPGRDGGDAPVYLPIDAKFPQEDFQRYLTALDAGDTGQAEAAHKSLLRSMRVFAKDIREKYLDPPHTTDFAILFLPTESLYAEVARQPGLLEDLQRTYKIVVAGPTNLAALLNSLQMGFRTLAIQKRSSEVWKILGEVKTEFGRFGEVLAKARRKLSDADHELDQLIGTRSRQIRRRLEQVEELPLDSATHLHSQTGLPGEMPDDSP